MQNFSFQNIEILNKFQRYLYGHDDLFVNLTSLFEKKNYRIRLYSMVVMG
jgi:hypothetical protein